MAIHSRQQPCAQLHGSVLAGLTAWFRRRRCDGGEKASVANTIHALYSITLSQTTSIDRSVGFRREIRPQPQPLIAVRSRSSNPRPFHTHDPKSRHARATERLMLCAYEGKEVVLHVLYVYGDLWAEQRYSSSAGLFDVETRKAVEGYSYRIRAGIAGHAGSVAPFKTRHSAQ